MSDTSEQDSRPRRTPRHAGKRAVPTPLTVAITGPTGTLGYGLVPLLEADARIARIVGIARREFDPSDHSWSKMAYRRGDVRDQNALTDAFRGADIVAHLAFLVAGTATPETIREINVGGTMNAFRAAVAAGVKRFVYASSVAAYGFHRDNPIGMDETWPARPAGRFFYAQEKAELERLLHDEAAAHPEIDLYVLRPPIVLGPHTIGAKSDVPAAVRALVGLAAHAARKLPVRLPVFIPALPMQFTHEDDVGQAFLLCIVGAGPPATYNIAGDGVVTGSDVARELGLTPLPVPISATQHAARLLATVPRPPFVPAITEWIEAASHPLIVNSDKAKRDLGWQPHYSGLDALHVTLHPPT